MTNKEQIIARINEIQQIIKPLIKELNDLLFKLTLHRWRYG